MMGKFEQLTERLVHLSSESRQNETPYGARLTASPFKWGRTPHTRSSILKEPLQKKFVIRLRFYPGLEGESRGPPTWRYGSSKRVLEAQV